MIAVIYGYANFVAMVDAEKGRKLKEQVRRIIAKYGSPDVEYIRRERWQEPTMASSTSEASAAAPNASPPDTMKEPGGESENKQWWKFW